MATLYDKLPADQAFLHILLFLMVIGGYANTSLFNPSKDKYYAIILMRMDTREYTLVNYIYALLKAVIRFLPFMILFGVDRDVPLWLCILLSFAIAGTKLCFSGVILWQDEKKDQNYNKNRLCNYQWGAMALTACGGIRLTGSGICSAKVSIYRYLFGVHLIGRSGIWEGIDL